jgi:hypothetical protein
MLLFSCLIIPTCEVGIIIARNTYLVNRFLENFSAFLEKLLDFPAKAVYNGI